VGPAGVGGRLDCCGVASVSDWRDRRLTRHAGQTGAQAPSTGPIQAKHREYGACPTVGRGVHRARRRAHVRHLGEHPEWFRPKAPRCRRVRRSGPVDSSMCGSLDCSMMSRCPKRLKERVLHRDWRTSVMAIEPAEISLSFLGSQSPPHPGLAGPDQLGETGGLGHWRAFKISATDANL
jgi:hypothetical protein